MAELAVAQPVVAAAQVPVDIQGAVVVTGVPIGMPQFGIDAVPLLDAPTAQMLSVVNNFTIKQRVQWGEALTQGCCEQSNVYDVYDADRPGQGPIMVAVEKSPDCARCCCAPLNSLFVDFKNTAALPNAASFGRDQLLAMPTAMSMERPGCCCE